MKQIIRRVAALVLGLTLGAVSWAGLESVTHISDLNASWPLGSDLASTSDDHIRNIKTALKTDFPNITGAVTVTQTQLNAVGGSGITGFANPSISVGLTATNGSATTAMRSDATPALSQAIVPTWSGAHTFQKAILISGSAGTNNSEIDINNTDSSGGHWRVGDAIGASAGVFTIYDNLHSALRLQIGAAGNVTVNAPGSGVALTVSAVSGTHSTKIADSANNSFNAGFLEVPQNGQNGNYTLVLSDSGKFIYHASGDGAGDTYTIPANASVAYPLGTVLTFINSDTNSVSIAITTDTQTLCGTTTTGTRTLAQNGTANAIKVTSTAWIICGTGLT
jgi:hypothetical protein